MPTQWPPSLCLIICIDKELTSSKAAPSPLKGLGDFSEAWGRRSNFCGLFSTHHLAQEILKTPHRLLLLPFLYNTWSVGLFPVILLSFSLCIPASLAPSFTPHISLFAVPVTLQSTCSNLSSTSSQLISLAWPPCPWQLTVWTFRTSSVTLCQSSYCQQLLKLNRKLRDQAWTSRAPRAPVHCWYLAQKLRPWNNPERRTQSLRRG